MRHEARATESGGDETPPGPAVLPSAEARERLPPEEPASEHTERRLGKARGGDTGASPGTDPRKNGPSEPQAAPRAPSDGILDVQLFCRAQGRGASPGANNPGSPGRAFGRERRRRRIPGCGSAQPAVDGRLAPARV